MPYISRRSSDKSARRQAIDELLEYSKHSKSFYVLLIGATIMTIGGIFSDSIALVIASMIVAPLAFPILTLGLGVSVRDWRLFFRTAFLLLFAGLVVFVLAMLATYFFNDMRSHNVYVTFTGNLWISFIVALVAGVIAAYGTLQPKITSALTGIAIAVSLLPPLVAAAIGVTSFDWALASEGGSIFGLNILGIFIASTVVFIGARMKSEYRNNKEA